ncbi:hypothetical protein [Okeania sp. KiyG1]|uniref:hypothetical protein n=1 Tax=Okeania sp. KiyG1 TaxID=2720165 RepID=UPI0013C65BE6|nr:hypothetical protein [Okeania sp. KiyG1]NEP83858.1 hypothetical protein [Okeania sp. SIO3B3]GGA08029.1 hypothetical protein CYANOKiyG1_20540 [Okeania sp. KiyG1]
METNPQNVTSNGNGNIIAPIAGDHNTNNITQNNEFNESKEKSLKEAAQEIQELLEQLGKDYPTETLTQKRKVADEIIKKIDDNPTLKDKIISVIQAMGIEALMQLVEHPVVNVLKVGIEELL